MGTDTVARYCGVHILDNPFSLDGVFHYFIPPYMADAVVRGAFVTVPFGRANRKQVAVVVSVGDRSILDKGLLPDNLKPIEGVCRERLFLSDMQLSLCAYLKETTLCTMGEAVRTVVPASALASLVEYYRVLPTDPEQGESRRASLSASDLLVLDYLSSHHPLQRRSH